MPNQPLVELLPHQRIACDFMKTHPFCGLFLDVGAGKTCATLEALYELNEPGHVLVIGPKAVARATWPAEIEKFHFPFRIDSLIVNEKGKQRSRKNRLEIYSNLATLPPTMWFINREMVVDLIEHLPKQGQATIWPFPTVIIDEAQSFKSYKAKRFKALAKMRPAISRLIELSGTPTPNGLMDLWPLIYLLDEGARLGRYISHYRDKFFRPGRIKSASGYPVDWYPLPGSEDAIYNAVSDICISMRNIAHAMPPMTINDVYVNMDDNEWKLYKKMAKESVLEFDDGSEAIAANAAVLSAKLQQMASGALYTDGTNTEFARIHDRKLDAVISIIEQTGSPVLVTYHYHSDRDMLMKRFADDKIDAKVFDGTPDMIQQWNDRQIPVMLLQPASAGHGLNLQQGGHTLIWYTIPWNLEHYIQTNARLHRHGQTDPVIVHRILCQGTIDAKIADALEEKDASMSALIAAVDYAANQLSA